MIKKITYLLLLVFSLPFLANAQDLTGVWRGYFITDDGEQYRYEVQIDHVRSALTGVTYSYQDRRFYGKATFTGNYNRTSNNALVQEIRTVEVRMSVGSMSCIQKCQLTYSRSGSEEFLEGHFTSMFEKDEPRYGYRRGGDCGGGTMFLRKVPQSDFYLEPFLRRRTVSIPKDKNPPVVKKEETKTVPQKTQPVEEKKKPEVTISRPKTDPVVVAPKEEKKDIDGKINSSRKPAVSLPSVLKDRQTDLVQTIYLKTGEVTVSIYDNGEIDDDTISVYLNNELVLSKKRLTAAPLTIKLKMDKDHTEHELVMVAENLGRIPPNTSLMIVNAGNNRYQVRITSTEQKNAMVRFRYQE